LVFPQKYFGTRAGALRKTQSADVSRTDFARIAGRLSGNRQTDAGMLAETNYRTPAETIFEKRLVRPNKRIFNNGESLDHFAIIPSHRAKSVERPGAKT